MANMNAYEHDFLLPEGTEEGMPNLHTCFCHSQFVALCTSPFIFPQKLKQLNAGRHKYHWHQRSMQSGCFISHIGGPVAGQACMARYQPKHNRLLCIIHLGHLTQNLNDD
jgi:hypothetical protein